MENPKYFDHKAYNQSYMYIQDISETKKMPINIDYIKVEIPEITNL